MRSPSPSRARLMRTGSTYGSPWSHATISPPTHRPSTSSSRGSVSSWPRDGRAELRVTDRRLLVISARIRPARYPLRTAAAHPVRPRGAATRRDGDRPPSAGRGAAGALRPPRTAPRRGRAARVHRRAPAIGPRAERVPYAGAADGSGPGDVPAAVTVNSCFMPSTKWGGPCGAADMPGTLRERRRSRHLGRPLGMATEREVLALLPRSRCSSSPTGHRSHPSPSRPIRRGANRAPRGRDLGHASSSRSARRGSVGSARCQGTASSFFADERSEL